MLKKYFNKDFIEAGLDEAGRGCLAGPVCAAAVVLPRNFSNKQLNDSKELSHEQREELRIIIETEALSWGVAFIDNVEIDKINILNASFLAMHRALEKLSVEPELLLVDGNRFNPYRNIPYKCIIKGDGKYQSIAAASILAKTHRDEYMTGLNDSYPYYLWNENKGYPTKSHRKAIMEFGVTSYHRQSFRLYPLPEQMALF